MVLFRQISLLFWQKEKGIFFGYCVFLVLDWALFFLCKEKIANFLISQK